MTEEEIRDFWNTHPCGAGQIGNKIGEDYESFFERYDEFRYMGEKHILSCLDQIDFKDKRVLEIGLGLGADSEQIVKRGGLWSGIDLTRESVDRVKTRLKLRKLPYDKIEVGTVCNLPFETAHFDIVFSHGVLHHVPEIIKAQEEIARVLKPDGLLIVMLYAKRSINYMFSITILRRLGLLILWVLKARGSGICNQHLKNVRGMGILSYLRMSTFIHKNTDGPLNPYSKVYWKKDVITDFPAFKIVKMHQEFMHAPPLPVRWLPTAVTRILGWALWVNMKKNNFYNDRVNRQS